MKMRYRTFSYITLALYIVGIFIAAYFLYELPNDLTYRSKVIDLNELQQVQPYLNTVNLVLGVVLFLGLITSIFLIISNRISTEENVVYIERQSLGREMDDEDNEGDKERQSNQEKLKQQIRKLKDSEIKKEALWEKALQEVSKKYEASQGAVYFVRKEGRARFIELFVSYAFVLPESKRVRYELGEGLAGQVAKEGVAMNINEIPEGYIQIMSGLGQSNPSHLLIIPLKENNEVTGVVEIASFQSISKKDQEDITAAFDFLLENEKAPEQESQETETDKNSSK